MSKTVQEPLRDIIGRTLYEEPGLDLDWYQLSEDRREPWRKDADRIADVIRNYISTNSNDIAKHIASTLLPD